VTRVTGRSRDLGEGRYQREGANVKRIRIERKAPVRVDRDRYVVLPLDPRDPDVVRVKLLDRRRTAGTRP
jgi:hypothetical protein